MMSSKTSGDGMALPLENSLPCRLMANIVALVYNWWHLYVRFYDAEHHREAITSRPALLAGVARMTRHSGQSTIKVSLQHDKKELLVEAIKLVSKTLCRFYLNCGAMEHRAALEAASDPYLSPLVRRKMARSSS